MDARRAKVVDESILLKTTTLVQGRISSRMMILMIPLIIETIQTYRPRSEKLTGRRVSGVFAKIFE